ncbi:hypothetical protein KXR53_06980 [Inquilinus limosus]|uniref:hypothetical protein n=1 Tax=Inquilinus limosus TaxID=171674 RepID=UPI003F16579C
MRRGGAAPAVLLVLPPALAVFGLAPGLLALLPQLHLEGDGAADAEEEAAEAGLGLFGAVEIAGLEGGDALGLEAAGQPEGELRQPGQHLGLAGSLVRGRRSGGGCPGCDGTIDHGKRIRIRRMSGAITRAARRAMPERAQVTAGRRKPRITRGALWDDWHSVLDGKLAAHERRLRVNSGHCAGLPGADMTRFDPLETRELRRKVRR